MKKIFLWGDYDSFNIGHIKYRKQLEDFLLITVRCKKNFRHQIETMIDEIKYIKGNGYMKEFFIKEKPDFLAVLSGHQSINTMQEFNKTKLLAEENGASLIIIKGYQCGNVVSVNPMNIYEQLNQLLTIGV